MLVSTLPECRPTDGLDPRHTEVGQSFDNLESAWDIVNKTGSPEEDQWGWAGLLPE